MKRRIGDMFSVIPTLTRYDMLCVTTNNVTNRTGRLVMGAGAAGELASRYPAAPRMFGGLLDFVHSRRSYGLIPVYPSATIPFMLGAFQTKAHYREPSRLDLIEHSTAKLAQFIDEIGLEHVHLNFPGIGLGGLTVDQVLPIIQTLPDNVTIWEK